MQGPFRSHPRCCTASGPTARPPRRCGATRAGATACSTPARPGADSRHGCSIRSSRRPARPHPSAAMRTSTAPASAMRAAHSPPPSPTRAWPIPMPPPPLPPPALTARAPGCWAAPTIWAWSSCSPSTSGWPTPWPARTAAGTAASSACPFPQARALCWPHMAMRAPRAPKTPGATPGPWAMTTPCPSARTSTSTACTTASRARASAAARPGGLGLRHYF